MRSKIINIFLWIFFCGFGLIFFILLALWGTGDPYVIQNIIDKFGG